MDVLVLNIVSEYYNSCFKLLVLECHYVTPLTRTVIM